MKSARTLLLALAVVSSSVFAQGYTATRYPIVLVHTFMGFEDIGPIEYWYGIPHALREGGAEVFSTRVSAVNASEVRGEQLLHQVQQVLAITGADKVNLIAHSLGGQTARYVAAVAPDQVASVTSIGSPVLGTPAGDFVYQAMGVPYLGPLLKNILQGLAIIVDWADGDARLPQDAVAGVDTLTSAGNMDFNERYPNGVPSTYCGEGDYEKDGIYYFSWAGSYARITNYRDPSSYALALTRVFFNEPNNGLIGRCSSHFGKVIRDNYAMDHLDEVNQLLGLTHPYSTNPKSLYRQHANLLRNLGL
jgi:triacylglycerol lipase